MTATKTMPVAALENGTVIDHIPAGCAQNLLQMLKLADHKKQISVGIRLPSVSLEVKDLIKVCDWEMPEEIANQIGIIAPAATISIIRDYEISRKFTVCIPESVHEIILCPNPKCITNFEITKTRFLVEQMRDDIHLVCDYCRRQFSIREVSLG